VKLLPQDGEILQTAARRRTGRTGGLTTLRLIIVLGTRGLATEAEARGSAPEGAGGKDADHDFPGFEAHPLLLGHCPVQTADFAATLIELQAMPVSLAEVVDRAPF
jgi:hypothetical protein